MKMLSRCPAVLLLMVATMFAAAGTKPMTIEDSLAIKSIGAPQWSPDGRWVAYTLFGSICLNAGRKPLRCGEIMAGGQAPGQEIVIMDS